jgi:6,7-dimethyl-8-ribityllumazine synthase
MRHAVVTARARTEEDFNLLTKMLLALGYGTADALERKDFRLRPFFPSESILEIAYYEATRRCPDLDLTISDPDSAIEVIEKLGLDVLEDHSDPNPKGSSRHFYVQLPGGTTIRVVGIRTAGLDPSHTRSVSGSLHAENKKFAIVVSRFNSFITERLLGGCTDALLRCRVNPKGAYDIVRVPGAFEIPSAARTLAETKKYDAIICIGCLLRGDTAHYDVIVNEVTRGIGQSAQETGVPHAFGVLTCDTLEQAIDRAGLKMGNKGFEAALAAVEMASLKKIITSKKKSAKKSSRK